MSLLSAAARLASPWDRSLHPGEVELVGVVRVLKANKVPFPLLERKFGGEIMVEPFLSILGEQKARWTLLRGEFAKINSRLAAGGDRPVLVKSTGLYPSFPYLSDNLDVLVSDGERARMELHRLGYIELVNTEEPGKFLFRSFPAPFQTIAVHLHEEVGWGVPFLDGGEVLASARPAPDDGDILIPSPEHGLLVTLAHWFYEDKTLDLANMFLTAQAILSLRRPLREVEEMAAARGWEDGFVLALHLFDAGWRRVFREGFFSARGMTVPPPRRFADRVLAARVAYPDDIPLTMPFLANKLVYYRKVLRDGGRSRLRRLADVGKTVLWAVRWKLRIKSQKPLLVALSGIDGSGKTAQAEALFWALSQCDVKTKVIWARGASSPLFSIFSRMGKRLLGISSSRRTGEETRNKQRRGALAKAPVRFIYGVLVSLELFWSYAVKTRLFLLLGYVVLCDRYLADARVDLATSTGRSWRAAPVAFRFLEAFSPRPHLSFLLDVGEEEALARKPEEGGREHLGQARRSLLQWAQNAGATVLGPEASLAEVHKRIVSEVLDRFYRHYGTVLNRLLWSHPDQINPGRWRPDRVR